MFLRDLYCSVCGSIVRDVPMDDPRQLVALRECSSCHGARDFVAMCNGGCGSRFRDCDLPEDPRFYRGQVEVEAPEATVSGKAVTDESGKHLMQEQRRFSQGARAEKRERIHWETDRKRGYTPLHFDQRRGSNA